MTNSTPKPDEGIGLKLSDRMDQTDILLLPEDSGPLYRELLNAEAKTHPEEVGAPASESPRTTDTVMAMSDLTRPKYMFGIVYGSKSAEECTRYSLTFKRDQVTKLGHHD